MMVMIMITWFDEQG